MKRILAGLLCPLTLFAMQQETPTNTQACTDEPVICATASFHSISEGKKKQFSRFLSPRYNVCDADGNVEIVDSRNISLKTNKYSPMFHVDMKPLALNIRYQQMKVACTIYNEYNEAQTESIEVILPLDTKYTTAQPLTLLDDAHQPVLLLFETWPSLQNMKNNYTE